MSAQPSQLCTHRTRIVLLVAGLVYVISAFSTGCVTIGNTGDQPTHTYVFEPESPQYAVGLDARVLLISAIRAASGYGTHRMVYTDRPSELNFFAYNQWADAPAQMLHPLVVSALETNRLFSAIVDSSNSVLADLRLDTEILALHQDFNAEPSVVRLRVRVQLTDLHERCVLGTDVVDISQPTTTDDPYSGVEATNLALTQVLHEVLQFAQETRGAGCQ